MTYHIVQIDSAEFDHTVTWPGRGAVTSIWACHKIFRWAFDTGALSVSFLGKYGVITIDAVVIWSLSDELFAQYIRDTMTLRLYGLHGVRFKDFEHAADFAKTMDQHLLIRMLSLEYS